MKVWNVKGFFIKYLNNIRPKIRIICPTMFLIISSLPKFMQICLVNLGKSFKKENPWYFRIMRKKYFCKVYSESEKFFIRIIGKGNARVYILSR